MDMAKRDEETYCMNLRGISCWTADVLYELKTLTDEPLYEWVNRMVAYYVQHHPSMLEKRLEEVRLLAAEYGANDGTP
jgi:hypothetical protein